MRMFEQNSKKDASLCKFVLKEAFRICNKNQFGGKSFRLQATTENLQYITWLLSKIQMFASEFPKTG